MSDGAPAVTVICGGVGAARFLLGLREVVPAQSITAIVNVADDLELHGLRISPDLDTITYTLADEIDPERGWGLRDESWKAMQTVARFGRADWFSLGDRDLGTHLHRTRRLDEGATLTEVTAELAQGWGVVAKILPVTNDPIATMVTLASDAREIGFQDYFVGHKHEPAVSAVRFDGIEASRATAATLDAIESADVIIFAPSNPIVSIAPVLQVPGVTEALLARASCTVAISPIVGGAALKGPAAAMLMEMGHEASAVGVAGLLARYIDVLVIDDVDAALAHRVANVGLTPVVANTLMSDRGRSARLARTALAAAALGVVNR